VIAAVLTGYPQVMLAIGRPRALLIMNIAMLVFYAAVITAASSHGLIVVSVGVVVAYTVNLLGIYHFLLKRHVDISVMRLFPELGPAVVGCLALLAVAFPLQHLLVPVLPRPLVIAAVGLTGLGVYGAVLYGAFRPAWEDLYGLVVRLVPPIGRIRLTRAAPASAPAGT
jgi:hypothetical protein